jgi:hypothetical protein
LVFLVGLKFPIHGIKRYRESVVIQENLHG